MTNATRPRHRDLTGRDATTDAPSAERAVTDVTAALLHGVFAGARARGDTGLLEHDLDPRGTVIERTVCLDRLPGAPRRLVGRLAAMLDTTAPPQDPTRRNLVVVEGGTPDVEVVATFGISPSGHGRVTLQVRSTPVPRHARAHRAVRRRTPPAQPPSEVAAARPGRSTPHRDPWMEISRRHRGRRHATS